MNSSENKKETCGYCGVIDSRVEAFGAWYCPNVLCSGVGVMWFRSKLPSYKDLGNLTYSIDREELETLGKAYLKKNEPEIYEFLFPQNSVLLSFPNKRYLNDFLLWLERQSKLPFDVPQTEHQNSKLSVSIPGRGRIALVESKS